MSVGRITFGPVPSPDTAGFAAFTASMRVPADIRVQACGCLGPQPGQTKCPCALRNESERGRRMVRDGIVIDGVEYELVRKGER